jgi:hypothetical protein
MDTDIVGNAEFQGVEFRSTLTLDSAHIGKSAFFESATFKSDVDVTGLEVGQDAVFDGATFYRGPVPTVPEPSQASDLGTDTRVTTAQEIEFNEVRVHGDLLFERTAFTGKTSFDDAIIDGVSNSTVRNSKGGTA